MNTESLTKRIRIYLLFFIIALTLSGVTAFPLAWELSLLNQFVSQSSLPFSMFPDLVTWIAFVNRGVQETYRQFPFMAYGTDWLAFAHIVIAVAFYGAFKNPVRNKWVVEFGMIACILVVPTALIFGALRGIPLFWQLIDCSFGVFGIIPLWLCHRMILRLEEIAPYK